MREITTTEIQYDFDKYNKAYFNGKIKTPTFKIVNSPMWKGVCSDFGKNGIIKISSYYTYSSKDIKSVLLHEMIHLYMAQQGMKEKDSHGYIFQKISSLIERKSKTKIYTFIR